MPSAGSTSRIHLLPTFLVLASPLVAGAFLSTGWSWGWDHLYRASPAWRYLVLVLTALVWVHPARRSLLRAAEWVGTRLEQNSLALSIAISLAGLAVFSAFPIATRMYGDSRELIDDHTGASLGIHVRRMLSLGLQFRGSATFVLHDLLSWTTGVSYEHCYMAVSILCGGVFLFAHTRLAGKIPGISPTGRAIILWLGLTDGANQLFFGHIENYTVARLFACLFLIGLVRSLLDPEHPPRRLRTIAWLVMAVFFHAQWLILVPTAVLWLGQDVARRRPALEPWFGLRGAVVAIAGALLVSAITYLAAGSYCYDYIYSGGRPHPRQLFLPVSTACVGVPYLNYALFAASHLADLIGSLYSVSSPAILMAFAFLLPLGSLRGRGSGAASPGLPDGTPALVPGPVVGSSDGRVILFPAIALGFLHCFILNPAIGYPFDWDLMCVLSPPLLYTAVYLIGRAGEPRLGSVLPALFLLGLGTLTLFGVNASHLRVYHRVEDMGVWLHRTYYGGSHYRLSSNLSTVADPVIQVRERARVLQRLMPNVYPDDWEVGFLWERLALERVRLDDYAGAKEAFERAVEVQPSKWQLLKPLGYLETEIGDLPRGIRLLGDYLAKAPTDPEAWLFLADACERAGRTEEARKSFLRVLELAPDSPDAPRIREQLRRIEQVPRQ